MRSKKALMNFISSIVLQLVNIVCGFIIPKLIITEYGSNINGLIGSINQFLGIIALIEGGIGAVVRASLYAPLANADDITVNKILKTTENFFRKIAYIFIFYLVIVAIIFPLIVNNEFNSLFTISLVCIIGISTFFQYFFGLTYQQLLQADQKTYIVSWVHIFSVISNAIMIVMLVKLGKSIHIVKIVSAFIFIIKPLALQIYVRKNYKILKRSQVDNSLLNQKWDALGHHIAYFLHNSADVILLTLFTNVAEVSVYLVYSMVIVGIRGIIKTLSSAVEAAFGNMIAKNEKEVLLKNFNKFECVFFLIMTALFSSTLILILPFINVYTKGIVDANYYRPIFAYILIFAEIIYCIRLPYHSIVMATGHIKQTRNGAFIEAGINIIVSFLLIRYMGSIGVAIGTLCAMSYRTIQYIIYTNKKILIGNRFNSIKRILVNAITLIIILISVKWLPSINIDTYAEWVVYAVLITIYTMFICTLINFITYKKELVSIINAIKIIFKHKVKV